MSWLFLHSHRIQEQGRFHFDPEASRQHPHGHALQLFDDGHGHAAGAQHFVDALVVPAGDFAGGEAVAAFDVEDEDDLLQQQLHGAGPFGCGGDGCLLGCLYSGRQRCA